MASGDPVVETRQGRLRGREKNGIRSFRGIRFARPPRAGLRFRPPQPPESWAGTREASRLAPRHSTDSLAGYVADLGAAPLDFQPGTEWAYSGLAGIDTLGRIVEVASGLTFDEFLRQRIFVPLGMKDTAFVIPGDRQSRVVTLYSRTPAGLERRDVPEWVATTTLHSGGGGLWSTAEDYLQFAQMLVNSGELDGTRLLGPRTVDLMASNHVGDLFAKSGRTGGRPARGSD